MESSPLTSQRNKLASGNHMNLFWGWKTNNIKKKRFSPYTYMVKLMFSNQ